MKTTPSKPARVSAQASHCSALSKQDQRNQDIAALYGQHAPQLIATLRTMFGSGPPDPEDVAQQAFEKILARDHLNDIRNLNAFLWRTARNICLKGRRHEDVRSKFDFEIEHLFFPRRGDDSTAEGVLRSKQELQAINDALRQMPDKRRRAFLLNKVEGLSVTEVAERLNIGRSPATRHISRAYRDIELHLARQNAETDDNDR